MAKTVLVPHTIDWRGGVMAGFLVRTPGGRPLGYIWATGATWRWRTPDGANGGERSSQGKAIDVLQQVAELQPSATPLLASLRESLVEQAREGRGRMFSTRPLPTAPPVWSSRPTAATAPAAPTPPPAPRKTIVWGDDGQGDVTSTLDALLQKESQR
jgi:hypothetical protein